jgi:Icc-related predicted phosphoesterase
MNVAVFSDVHLEFCNWIPPSLQADVVVLAGDIHMEDGAFAWARRHFGDMPIVYVPGNHEYFDSDMPTALQRMRAGAQQHGIDLLHDREIQIGGVRFLGTTLWTDFEFYGSAPADIEHAMAVARRRMRDYEFIEYSRGRALTPQLTRELHLQQRAWLRERLEADDGRPVVVVTHHLPHRGSVHAKHEGEATNPAFVSDLAHLFRESVKLWVHGHTHESVDYTAGATRVVCNPRGYLPHEPNPDFDPGLVVKLK